MPETIIAARLSCLISAAFFAGCVFSQNPSRALAALADPLPVAQADTWRPFDAGLRYVADHGSPQNVQDRIVSAQFLQACQAHWAYTGTMPTNAEDLDGLQLLPAHLVGPDRAVLPFVTWEPGAELANEVVGLRFESDWATLRYRGRGGQFHGIAFAPREIRNSRIVLEALSSPARPEIDGLRLDIVIRMARMMVTNYAGVTGKLPDNWSEVEDLTGLTLRFSPSGAITDTVELFIAVDSTQRVVRIVQRFRGTSLTQFIRYSFDPAAGRVFPTVERSSPALAQGTFTDLTVIQVPVTNHHILSQTPVAAPSN